MILIGECREKMKELIADGVKVQMCVTSPPYFGLRDYGTEGQLGMEETPGMYVENMVEVFSLVRELLADDGTLWLNLGDTYSAHKDCESIGQTLAKGTSRENAHVIEKGKSFSRNSKMLKSVGLKNKDLIGIPWAVAFALRADGWYLRSDIIWNKPNPMPESVKDRPTKSHEYIFLLSKNADYYYNYEAILEKANYDGRQDTVMKGSDKYKNGFVPGQSEQSFHARGHERWREDKNGNKVRNKRSVWTVNTASYRGSHFTTFPPALITPCILAGSRPGDTVLDPFFGSGTTGEVAEKLGRKWIGIDINPSYEKLQRKRTAQKGLTFCVGLFILRGLN